MGQPVKLSDVLVLDARFTADGKRSIGRFVNRRFVEEKAAKR